MLQPIIRLIPIHATCIWLNFLVVTLQFWLIMSWENGYSFTHTANLSQNFIFTHTLVFSVYCNLQTLILTYSILLLFTSDGPDIDDGIQFELKTAPNVDPPVFQLTCTSSTAPATTVQWSKDGSPVSGGSSSQIVTDTVEATYINELTVTGRQSGTYTCNVTTWRAYRDDQGPDTMVGSSVTAFITVEGIYILAGFFIVSDLSKLSVSKYFQMPSEI